MDGTEVYRQLQQEDLFEGFRLQLKKDFGSAGVNEDFTDSLSREFENLKAQVLVNVEPLLGNSALLGRLLNRVDISEKLLKEYVESNPGVFAEALSELIIKRVLQKVILRKKFSK